MPGPAITRSGVLVVEAICRALPVSPSSQAILALLRVWKSSEQFPLFVPVKVVLGRGIAAAFLGLYLGTVGFIRVRSADDAGAADLERVTANALEGDVGEDSLSVEGRVEHHGHLEGKVVLVGLGAGGRSSRLQRGLALDKEMDERPRKVNGKLGKHSRRVHNLRALSVATKLVAEAR